MRPAAHITALGVLLSLLLNLLPRPAAAQLYFDFLPDSIGQRLLQQKRVRELRWTVEDLRYHSTSLYRVITLDGHGGWNFRDGNEPEPEVVASASTNPAPPAAPRGPVIQRDGRGRPTLKLQTMPYGEADTLASYRYSARGDTAWMTTHEYGDHRVERSFTQDKGRVYRYDRLEYRHPIHAPEAPLYLHEVKAYYLRFDDRHRQVESGDVDYQSALTAWLQERLARGQDLPGGPDQFIESGGMYPLQLSGRLAGEYRPTQRVAYDRLGRVSETWSTDDEEGLRRFRYDETGRVAEITCLSQEKPDGPPSRPTGSALFVWGGDGLPQRVETRDGGGQVVLISTYTYAHFPDLPATH